VRRLARSAELVLTNKPKILVVEDDPTTSEFIRVILEAEGYQISAAYDGQQALVMAEQECPDLITLNVVMPRLDGFEACRRLKNSDKTKDVPVVFLTGQSSADQIARGYDLGADHYITKPFHAAVFVAQVRRSLRMAGHTIASQTLTSLGIPKVFISYKWEGDDHNDWVMKLAVALRSAGIDAFLDRWEVRLGDSFIDYMTSRINKADVVLFIMTTASVASVEAGGKKGGAVKFEMQLASSRKMAGENVRIIPICREGNKTAAHVRDHRYADFRDDSKYNNALQMLVLDLLRTAPLLPPWRLP